MREPPRSSVPRRDAANPLVAPADARTRWAHGAEPATVMRRPAEPEPVTSYWAPRAATFLPADELRLEPEPATTAWIAGEPIDQLAVVCGGQARPQVPPPAASAAPPPTTSRRAAPRSNTGHADRSAAAPRPRTASGSSPQLQQPCPIPADSSLEPLTRAASIMAAGHVEPGTSVPRPAAPALPPGPVRVDATPEVAMAAYPTVRRVALQQDLKGADRVLRVGLSELTNATTCRTWYLGDDGEPFSLELHSDPAQVEKELIAQVVACAQPRAAGRVLVVPMCAGSKPIAVAMLARGDSMADFAPLDLLMSLVLLQETAGFIVQLLLDHSAKQRDLAADKRSIYNPEALASQRNRGNEGGLINIQPRWVKVAYPAAVLAVLLGIGYAIVARVPTYSTGAGVVTIEGIEVTSPSPGTVAAIGVQPGQPVRAGEELARLLAQDEESALAQADREYRNALATLLFDGSDEASKAAVATAAAARQRAVDRLEARVIRAPKDGVVGDVRVRGGVALAAGDHVLTLMKQEAEPTVLVFLPGQDRPRLRRGQSIQIDLSGYTKVRERGTIVEVGAEVIGPNEARRALGQKNADAVPLSGPVVMVRATLPNRTFKVNRDTFRYHDGMPLRGEVKVENKPFLVSLVPALEKIF